MGSANCYVCNRGFDHIDLLYAHLIEHPGRTAEEMRLGKEAYGRLKGTDKRLIDREAEHNDVVEATTEHPGVAVNEALAKLPNRQKLVAVGAKDLADRDFETDDTIETGLVPTKSPLSRAEWERHDKVAEAQRQPYNQMAQNFAERHLYDAREIPFNEHVGNHHAVEMAQRNDAQEAAVALERERVLDLMDETDRKLRTDAVLTDDGDFDPTLPDTEATRRAFRSHKDRLMEERRLESEAVFAEQFPEEAKKRGIKPKALPAKVRQGIDQQKADAKAAAKTGKRGFADVGRPLSEHDKPKKAPAKKRTTKKKAASTKPTPPSKTEPPPAAPPATTNQEGADAPSE